MLNKMFNFVPLPLSAATEAMYTSEADRKIQYCGGILLVDTFFLFLRDLAISERIGGMLMLVESV